MITIDTSQMAGLAASLEHLENRIKGEVALAGVASLARVVYDQVKENTLAHVKTGTLHAAIYRAYSPEKSSDFMKRYKISWNKRKAPHGHLLEFGTVRAPAYPFLWPATASIPAGIEAAMARMAEKLTESSGGGGQ